MRNGRLRVAALTLAVWLLAAATDSLACARGAIIVDVGTTFRVGAESRGEPAVGAQLLLMRGDSNCHAGETLAQAVTDASGTATFRSVSAGSATLCAVSRTGERWAAASLRIHDDISSEQSVKTSLPGWNALAVRSASGVIRIANFESDSDGQDGFRVQLMDAHAAKALYETKSNERGEFSFRETIPAGRYYLFFRHPKYGSLDGGIPIEVRADAKYPEVNLDAIISDCGMSSLQREPREPAKVAVACGRLFDSEKKPGGGWPVLLVDDDMKTVERVVAGANGEFSFGAHPAGHYVVYAPRPADLPARQEIQLQPDANARSCTQPLRLEQERGYSD